MILEGVSHAGEHSFIFDANVLAAPSAEMFSQAYWQGRIVGTGQGRGTALFVDGLTAGASGSWVLRHYHRGGLPARFSPDAFLFEGVDKSRPFREWRVLRDAHAQGLPVPRPIAGHVHRQGLIYRGGILMQRVLNASSLADLLAQKTMPAGAWESLAQAIARYHRLGYWHADLNARNVLLCADDAKWYLIDFDRARKRAPGAWAQANIQRLHRSLMKLSRAGELSFDPADWELFLQAYRTAR